ncbi:MAG: hypothetical protein O2951_12110 [Bacteroidetes bacterium]|nr:hypothetical protein [Bacteroidota bacterium]
MKENTSIDEVGLSAPVVEWHKGYGTDNGEHVHEIRQTADGGYIAIGQTSEANDHGSNVLVIKIDGEGEFLWQKEFGTPGNYDVGICVNETIDGYVIGGGLVEGNQNRFLAKLDFSGQVIWKRTYLNQRAGLIRGIEVLDYGDLVLTGFKDYADNGFVFIANNSLGFVMKVSDQGEMIWEKAIAASQGAKIRKALNGYVICTTKSMNDPETPQDMQLIKLDEEGNEIWNKHYGGDSDEHCYDCDVTSEGGYILGGHSRSPSYGVVNWDYLMVKVDADGNEEWHRIFGQPRGYDPEFIHDEAYGVRETADGGFVIVGGSGDEYSYSASGSPNGDSDIWKVYAVKVDKQGDVLWEKVYGSPVLNNAGEYMGITSDGGYIIGTDSDSAGKDDFEPNNFGFMKLGPDTD